MCFDFHIYYKNIAKFKKYLMLQGAVVEFDKVELKMSRKQQLYCQYLVASSVTIVTLPSKDTSLLRYTAKISQIV